MKKIFFSAVVLSCVAPVVFAAGNQNHHKPSAAGATSCCKPAGAKGAASGEKDCCKDGAKSGAYKPSGHKDGKACCKDEAPKAASKAAAKAAAKPAGKPAPVVKTSAAALPAGQKAAVLNVKMECAGCAQGTEVMVSRIPGVVKAKSDLKSQSMAVTYVSAKTSPAHIVKYLAGKNVEASVKVAPAAAVKPASAAPEACPCEGGHQTKA